MQQHKLSTKPHFFQPSRERVACLTACKLIDNPDPAPGYALGLRSGPALGLSSSSYLISLPLYRPRRPPGASRSMEMATLVLPLLAAWESGWKSAAPQGWPGNQVDFRDYS
jgi:hypothetical protein